MKKTYKITAKGKKAEILIYEDIGDGWLGGISAKAFADDVKALGKLDEINVRINSSGGSVFDGVTMYNTLVRNQARIIVDIDGLAASIASIIAMAGDEVRMAENAMMMIHDPWIVTAGTAEELRDQADVMDKVRETLLTTYVSRSSADETTISDMMAAETWMTAADAEEVGLIDSVTAEVKMAAIAGFDLAKYKNVPEDFKAAIEAEAGDTPRSKSFQDRFAKMSQTLLKEGI